MYKFFGFIYVTYTGAKVDIILLIIQENKMCATYTSKYGKIIDSLHNHKYANSSNTIRILLLI